MFTEDDSATVLQNNNVQPYHRYHIVMEAASCLYRSNRFLFFASFQ